MGVGAAVTKPSPTAPTLWGARTFRVILSGGDGSGFYPPESSQVGCKLSQGEGVIWSEAALYHQGDAGGGSQLVAPVAAEGISPLARRGLWAAHHSSFTGPALYHSDPLVSSGSRSSGILVVSFPGDTSMRK